MYSHITSSTGAGLGAGTLASTGFDSLWLGLAAFALVAAGTAILRIIPTHHRPLDES